MNRDDSTKSHAINTLVDEYRARCLWFFRSDYYPSSEDEIDRVLDAIERHGDLAAFKKVAALRQWLSQNSNEPSAS